MLLSIFLGFGYAHLRIKAKESQRNLHNRRWGIWSSQCSSGLRVWREVGGGRQKAARMAWQCEGRDYMGWKSLWEYSRHGWLVHIFRIGIANVELEIVGTFQNANSSSISLWLPNLNKVYYIFPEFVAHLMEIKRGAVFHIWVDPVREQRQDSQKPDSNVNGDPENIRSPWTGKNLGEDVRCVIRVQVTLSGTQCHGNSHWHLAYLRYETSLIFITWIYQRSEGRFALGEMRCCKNKISHSLHGQWITKS